MAPFPRIVLQAASLPILWSAQILLFVALAGWVVIWPLGLMASYSSAGGVMIFTIQMAASLACLVLLTQRSSRWWAWLLSVVVAGWPIALLAVAPIA